MHRTLPIHLRRITRLSIECRGTARICDIAGPAGDRKQLRSTLKGIHNFSHRLSLFKDASCPQVSERPAGPVEEGSIDRERSLGRSHNALDKPKLWPEAFPPWQWALSLTWRSACLFFLGSILFTLSCSTGLFHIMANHSLRNRLCVAYPYAAGSILYTWGAYCTMVASADAVKQSQIQEAWDARVQVQAAALRQPVQLMPVVQPPEASACEAKPAGSRAKEYALFTGDASASGAKIHFSQLSDCCSTMHKESLARSPKPSFKAFTVREACKEAPVLLMDSLDRILRKHLRLQLKLQSFQDWALLDLTGAVIVWVGTLLYNSSCIAPAILATLTVPLPAGSLAAVLQWAVKIPNIIAGCFFVTGSYLAWAAAARSFSLLHVCQHRLPTGSFWASLLYFLGSVGFLTGALLSEPVFVLPASILIDEWFGMFVGYFLGSLCFLSGSYLGMSAVE